MTAPIDFFAAFAGTHRAYGVVLNPFGALTKKFTGLLRARAENDVCKLHEEFNFDDGELYQRDWLIKRVTATNFTATAGDVIGAATARVDGNVAIWDYPQRLKIGKNGLVVHVTDYMIFMPDGICIGYTHLRKFGLPVGKLLTTFQRQSDV